MSGGRQCCQKVGSAMVFMLLPDPLCSRADQRYARTLGDSLCCSQHSDIEGGSPRLHRFSDIHARWSCRTKQCHETICKFCFHPHVTNTVQMRQAHGKSGAINRTRSSSSSAKYSCSHSIISFARIGQVSALRGARMRWHHRRSNHWFRRAHGRQGGCQMSFVKTLF